MLIRSKLAGSSWRARRRALTFCATWLEIESEYMVVDLLAQYGDDEQKARTRWKRRQQRWRRSVMMRRLQAGETLPKTRIVWADGTMPLAAVPDPE